VHLLPAQYVRLYRRRNKNDRADCLALLEAAKNPEILPVPIKDVQAQAIQGLHRIRSQWLAARTARINGLRGLLREFGQVLPVGAVRALRCLRANAAHARGAGGARSSQADAHSRAELQPTPDLSAGTGKPCRPQGDLRPGQQARKNRLGDLALCARLRSQSGRAGRGVGIEPIFLLTFSAVARGVTIDHGVTVGLFRNQADNIGEHPQLVGSVWHSVTRIP
jgi:hypothetical protein